VCRKGRKSSQRAHGKLTESEPEEREGAKLAGETWPGADSALQMLIGRVRAGGRSLNLIDPPQRDCGAPAHCRPMTSERELGAPFGQPMRVGQLQPAVCVNIRRAECDSRSPACKRLWRPKWRAAPLWAPFQLGPS